MSQPSPRAAPLLETTRGRVISGLFNEVQATFGRVDNYRTYAPNFGERYQIYNGLELSLNARTTNGVQFQVGSSTGQTVSDNCEIRAKLPETDLLDPDCHDAPGITTRVTGAPRSGWPAARRRGTNRSTPAARRSHSSGAAWRRRRRPR